MTDALFLFVALVALGAQVTLPGRLAGGLGASGRNLALLPAPLLAAGLTAGYAHYASHPDAALAWELAPLSASLPGRLLLVFLLPWLLAAILAAVGRDRLEPAAWRILQVFGGVGVVLVSWIAERVRIGDGPAPAMNAFVALVACRVLLTFAAGELAAPRLSWLPVAGCAALALQLPLLFLPATRPLGEILWRSGGAVTAACGALAFGLAALPAVPPRLRRAALAGGLLLAALFLSRSAELSQILGENPTLPPMPPLPAF